MKETTRVGIHIAANGYEQLTEVFLNSSSRCVPNNDFLIKLAHNTVHLDVTVANAIPTRTYSH